MKYITKYARLHGEPLFVADIGNFGPTLAVGPTTSGSTIESMEFDTEESVLWITLSRKEKSLKSTVALPQTSVAYMVISK